MSDLTLQDFRDLFSEKLAQVLSDEKQKMFGDRKSHVKKGGGQPLVPRIICRFFCSLPKRRGLRPIYSLIPGKERRRERNVKT
jgi:hypothetical protein